MTFVVHYNTDLGTTQPHRSSTDLSQDPFGTLDSNSSQESPVGSRPAYIPTERRSDIVSKRGLHQAPKTLVISPSETASRRLSQFFSNATTISGGMRQRRRQGSESTTIQDVMHQMELLNRDFTVQISEYQDYIINIESQNKTLVTENEALKNQIRKVEYQKASEVRRLESRVCSLEKKYTSDFENLKQVHNEKIAELLQTIQDLATTNKAYKQILRKQNTEPPIASLASTPVASSRVNKERARSTDSDRDFIETQYREALTRSVPTDNRTAALFASIDDSLATMHQQLMVTGRRLGRELEPMLAGLPDPIPAPAVLFASAEPMLFTATLFCPKRSQSPPPPSPRIVGPWPNHGPPSPSAPPAPLQDVSTIRRDSVLDYFDLK
ncbi:hypothetical protein H4R33_000027 [Dimargaris cristalligena]|nr:hypothetical protein H4R33_000027 [Dimargaris cristalligena]